MENERVQFILSRLGKYKDRVSIREDGALMIKVLKEENYHLDPKIKCIIQSLNVLYTISKELSKYKGVDSDEYKQIFEEICSFANKDVEDEVEISAITELTERIDSLNRKYREVSLDDKYSKYKAKPPNIEKDQIYYGTIGRSILAKIDEVGVEVGEFTMNYPSIEGKPKLNLNILRGDIMNRLIAFFKKLGWELTFHYDEIEVINKS